MLPFCASWLDSFGSAIFSFMFTTTGVELLRVDFRLTFARAAANSRIFDATSLYAASRSFHVAIGPFLVGRTWNLANGVLPHSQ
jgi:hypothetical protein